jgi:hypothetical protein
MTEVKRCPHPEDCKAETSFDTMVTECPCGVIGWLGWNGLLYNHPNAIPDRPIVSPDSKD